MRYHLITFGCQMNKSDSERIATVLEKKGYKEASNINEADLIVLNMCSVRQSAVNRVYGKIRNLATLKAKNKKPKIMLTGCILDKDRKRLAENAKNFDFILNIKDFEKLTKIQPKYSNNFSAFIPISNGCNNTCAYCVVPFTRGKLISRDHREILKEAKQLIKKGFKEYWLLGQNVNNYQSPANHSIDFSKLLKMINDILGNFWIRFTSPHPKNFSDELIETIAKSKKITPYLNLPVQSGDNEVLKRMNRSYTIEQYKKLVKKIKNSFKKYRNGLEKEIALSTDVIVGFPDETKKQFQNTVKLFKEIGFDMAYLAQYSPRPGTAALKFKDNVSHQEKERRWKILNKILEETALKKNENYLGKEIEVLVEEEKDGFLIGKSRHYKTVTIEGQKNLIGQFVKVKITTALPWSLKANLS